MSGALPPSEDSTRINEGSSAPFEQHGDDEELDEDEMDVAFQAEKLAMEQDEESDDQEGDEDSEVDTESDQEGSESESDYNPNENRGSHRRAGVPHKHAGPSNSSKTFVHKKATKDTCERRKQKNKNLGYEFCPLSHRPSILRLLIKHFCQHPLLPDCHGQLRTAELIHSDSVYEAFLHCKRNHLREVWAYLWTSWYSPDKWRLWARLAYPNAIPRKRTTMVVEVMWRNFKRLVLYQYNCPRVDFATYALVTQALPAYRMKIVRILDDPRKGRAAALHGEQIPIKKAWLILRDKPIQGQYVTNVLEWTCDCGTKNITPTFFASTSSRRSLALTQSGGSLLYDATPRPSMTSEHFYHLRLEPEHQSLRY